MKIKRKRKMVTTKDGVKEIIMPQNPRNAKVAEAILVSGDTNVHNHVKNMFPDLNSEASSKLSEAIRCHPEVQRVIGDFGRLLDTVGADDVQIAVKLKEHLHATKTSRVYNKETGAVEEFVDPDYQVQDKALDKVLKLKDKYPKQEMTEQSIIKKIFTNSEGVSIENAEEIEYRKTIRSRNN